MVGDKSYEKLWMRGAKDKTNKARAPLNSSPSRLVAFG